MNQEVSLPMMDKEEDKFWHLERFNVIKALSNAEKMKLISLASMKNFKAGETIYLPASSQSRVFFLKQGLVKIIRITDAGEEQITDTLAPGELFGGLIEEKDNSEMAVALDDTLICYLDTQTWNTFIIDNHKFKLTVLKMVGLKLKKLEIKIERIQLLKIEDRIKVVLYELAKKHGKKLQDCHFIELKMNITHRDIAKLAGTARQSVTMVMRQLQRDQIINYELHKILIKSMDRLLV